MDVILKAEKRDLAVKAHELRNQGWVPGCVYGKSHGNTHIKVKQGFLKKCLNTGATLFHLSVEGEGKLLVGIDELQKGHMGNEFVHIAFHAVSQNEAITVDIPVHYEGKAVGITEGGIFQSVVDTIAVKGMAADIPDFITVDISQLHVGDSFHLGDLKENFKFEFVGVEAEKVLAVCNYPKKQEIETPVASAGEGIEVPVETEASAEEVTEDKEKKAA